MYSPSFVSGQLISRFGAARVQLAGVLVTVASTGVFLSGGAMVHYGVGQVLNVRFISFAALFFL